MRTSVLNVPMSVAPETGGLVCAFDVMLQRAKSARKSHPEIAAFIDWIPRLCVTGFCLRLQVTGGSKSILSGNSLKNAAKNSPNPRNKAELRSLRRSRAVGGGLQFLVRGLHRARPQVDQRLLMTWGGGAAGCFRLMINRNQPAALVNTHFFFAQGGTATDRP